MKSAASILLSAGALLALCGSASSQTCKNYICAKSVEVKAAGVLRVYFEIRYNGRVDHVNIRDARGQREWNGTSSNGTHYFDEPWAPPGSLTHYSMQLCYRHGVLHTSTCTPWAAFSHRWGT